MGDHELEFVTIVKDYPAVINKSQTPDARRAKAESLKEIQHRYMSTFGREITDLQIMKKIHNMKARIKTKMNLKKRGNEKIVLKKWEELFLNFIDRDDCNPTIHRIPDASVIEAASTPVQSCSSESIIDTDSTHFEPITIVNCGQIVIEEAPEVTIPKYSPLLEQQKSNKRRRLDMETEETMNLTNSELQRLVLLTQLDVLKRIREKLIREENQSVL